MARGDTHYGADRLAVCGSRGSSRSTNEEETTCEDCKKILESHKKYAEDNWFLNVIKKKARTTDPVRLRELIEAGA